MSTGGVSSGVSAGGSEVSERVVSDADTGLATVSVPGVLLTVFWGDAVVSGFGMSTGAGVEWVRM